MRPTFSRGKVSNRNKGLLDAWNISHPFSPFEYFGSPTEIEATPTKGLSENFGRAAPHLMKIAGVIY